MRLLLLVCTLCFSTIWTRKIASTTIIKNDKDQVVGPQLEFSSDVLKDGQTFSWTCRENSDRVSNTLQFKTTGDKFISYDDPNVAATLNGGNTDNEFCGSSASILSCTVVKAQFPFGRDKGGVYRCSSYPDEQYTIKWINPAIASKAEYNIGNDKYGETVNIYCALDMTPTDISYKDIVEVTWEHQNIPRKPVFSPISPSAQYEGVTPSSGSNFTLSIRDFSGLNDGGVYRCKLQVKGYAELLQSSPIRVNAKARARLTNNLRNSIFDFGIGEDAKFTCTVDAYPAVDSIQLLLDGQDVSKNPDYEFKSDPTDITTPHHYANMVIKNVSAALNGSIIQCKTKRGNIDLDVDRQTLTVLNEAPPIERETDNQYGRPYKDKSAKKPWVIAVSVIIPIVVILIIILFVVWRCRGHGDEGDYMVGRTYDPDESAKR